MLGPNSDSMRESCVWVSGLSENEGFLLMGWDVRDTLRVFEGVVCVLLLFRLRLDLAGDPRGVEEGIGG
jgi:hypothetical protein